MPQQQAYPSAISESNDIDKEATGSCDVKNENLDGETAKDSNKENNDSLAGSLNQEPNGTVASITFLKSCTTECRSTDQDNEGCTDSTQHMQKETDTSNGNGESRTASQGGNISEEKETTNAPVCHFKDVVAIVDPPRVGLHPTVSIRLLLMFAIILVATLILKN